MFADEMDMLSLIRWRLTCKTNYHQASAALRRTFIHLLNPFVPSPCTLIDIVSKYRGIFGGEFALAFILRDPTYVPQRLEIFSSDFDHDALCDAILDDPSIRMKIAERSIITNSVIDALRLLVSRTLVIRTTGGKTIYVHRSYTNSPCAPVSRAPCTALSNFVTAYGFACSHPRLTLNRRALLADIDLTNQYGINRDIQKDLINHKFTLSVSPAAWLEYMHKPPANQREALVFLPHTKDHNVSAIHDGPDVPQDGVDPYEAPIVCLAGAHALGDTPRDDNLNGNAGLAVAPPLEGTAEGQNTLDVEGTLGPQEGPASEEDRENADAPDNVEGPDDDEGIYHTDMPGLAEECWRHLFICPSQGRYFGDRGSFVEFFDPLNGDETLCADNGVAPFGPMVVWRVLSSFDCAEGCDIYDDVLEDRITSIPVLINKDPYGEVQDVVSDRYMGFAYRDRNLNAARVRSSSI